MDKRPLEKVVEQAVIKYGKALGIAIAYKMNGLSSRSWPDRMFLHRGRALFIEFKRKGEVPTPKQELNHKMLRDEGFAVLVIDDVESGKRALEKFAGLVPRKVH